MQRVSKLGAASALVATATLALASTASAVVVVKAKWESDAGRFRTMAAAQKHITALAAKGLTGYVIEVDPITATNKRPFEVNREFATKTAAVAEVARVHKAKLVARVEKS